jgi:hypothetical protein
VSAAAEINVDGIAIELQGVCVVRTGPHGLGVAAPTFRGPAGITAPAVSLPPELSATIARVVLDEFQAGQCQPAAAC